MMKIMAIMGSPRKKGNSSFLTERFLAKAREKGGEISSYFLEEMNYKGCKACGACKKTHDRCVISDDLTAVLDEMRLADIIIYAAPNYFADVSGQFKLFLDRTYSLLTPEFMTGANRSRLPTGKHLVFIFTQGAPEKFFKEIPDKYSHLKEYFNFSGFHIIHGGNLFAPEDAQKCPELIEKIDQLANELLN